LKLLYFLVLKNLYKKGLENWIFENLIFLRFVGWSTRRCKRPCLIFLRNKDIFIVFLRKKKFRIRYHLTRAVI